MFLRGRTICILFCASFHVVAFPPIVLSPVDANAASVLGNYSFGLTHTINPTPLAGSTIIVCLGWAAVGQVTLSSPVSVTDNFGNSYMRIGGAPWLNTGVMFMFVCFSSVSPAGGPMMLLMATDSVTYSGIFGWDYYVAVYPGSGIVALDVLAMSGFSIATPTLALPASSSQANEFAVCFVMTTGTCVSDPSWNSASLAHGDCYLDLAVPNSGSNISVTYGSSGSSGVILALFKVSPGTLLKTDILHSTTLVGSYVIDQQTSISVFGKLIVKGNLTVFGTLAVSDSGPVMVTDTLSVQSGSVLTPIISKDPGPVNRTTVLIAQAGSVVISRSFSVGAAIVTFSNTNCVVFGQPTVISSSASLSAIVPVVSNSCSTSSLSTGAIVGIAVGAAAFGILLALGSILLSRLVRKKHQALAEAALKDSDMKQLQSPTIHQPPSK